MSTPEPEYHSVVTISGCTAEQARRVLAERINYDEDYGFPYSIRFTEPKPSPEPFREVIVTDEATDSPTTGPLAGVSQGVTWRIQTLRCPNCLSQDIREIASGSCWNPMHWDGEQLVVSQRSNTAEFETDGYICANCVTDVALPEWLQGRMEWY